MTNSWWCLLFLPVIAGELDFNSKDYGCSICLSTVDLHLSNKNHGAILDTCMEKYSRKICEEMFTDVKETMVGDKDSRDVCRSLSMCPSLEESLAAYPRSPYGTGAYMDVRVTKAMGNKGYDKIRLSVISNTSIESEYFTYSSQFRYRWTSNYLSTGIVSVVPGQKTTLSVGGLAVEVLLPLEDAGIRGVIVADPCFQSEWIVCVYQKTFSTFSRTTELLNAINAFEDVSFWNILGDNFYDQSGEASAAWFAALSPASKAKVMGSVPGNHDFWVNASPQLMVPKDQLANGFMQFYAQDSLAASDTSPFDFSVDPDRSGRDAYAIPSAGNFFYYHKLGDVAFVGFSGAHSMASMQAAFEEACSWAAAANPKYVLLLGHWNSDGDGCEAESVPEVYSALSALPQCAPLMSRMKYFMGHKHCNVVTSPDTGFMVGAMGMADKSSCGGEFGFPVLDTTQGDLRVYYFSLAKEGQYDHYDQVLACIRSSGVSGCYHLATLWTGSSLL